MDFFVSGASGFVGRHLVPQLLKRGRVGVLLQEGKEVPSHLRSCDVEIGDVRTFDGSIDAEVIIHLAAEANPAACDNDPPRAVRINVEGTQRMLQASSDGVRFIFVSTGQVFGPTRNEITEARRPDPRNVYGASKLAAEEMVWAAHRRGNVKGVVLRPFNMYGPGQVGPYIVPDILRQLQNDEIILRSLAPARDFTFIGDAVELMCEAATRDEAVGETFHIASGQTHSVQDVAMAILAAAGSKATLRAQNPGDPQDVIRVDAEKSRRLLDWQPRTSLEAGAARVVASYQA